MVKLEDGRVFVALTEYGVYTRRFQLDQSNACQKKPHQRNMMKKRAERRKVTKNEPKNSKNPKKPKIQGPLRRRSSRLKEQNGTNQRGATGSSLEDFATEQLRHQKSGESVVPYLS